jgi:hypothetical protein
MKIHSFIISIPDDEMDKLKAETHCITEVGAIKEALASTARVYSFSLEATKVGEYDDAAE